MSGQKKKKEKTLSTLTTQHHLDQYPSASLHALLGYQSLILLSIILLQHVVMLQFLILTNVHLFMKKKIIYN